MNKKARMEISGVIMLIAIVMVIAYTMDFGGFQNIVNAAIEENSTVNNITIEGVSQHIIQDNASHTDSQIIQQVELQPEVQPVNPNTNIEPSFFQSNGLVIIFIILLLGLIGYLYYRRRLKNEKQNQRR